jgi:hypothetical protein
MAKRTRYQNRTKARPAAKRVMRTEADAASASLLGRPSPLETPSPPDAPGDFAAPTAFDDDMPTRSSGRLTDAELERAEKLEAELLARERAAIAESLRRSPRGVEPVPGGTADHNAPLSVRAAHEYAYVARDVKRIAATAALMIGILAALYILTNVLGVITL